MRMPGIYLLNTCVGVVWRGVCAPTAAGRGWRGGGAIGEVPGYQVDSADQPIDFVPENLQSHTDIITNYLSMCQRYESHLQGLPCILHSNGPCGMRPKQLLGGGQPLIWSCWQSTKSLLCHIWPGNFFP